MLIKIENDQPVGFPILEDNFRQLHPHQVFPLIFTRDIVEPYGYGMYDYTQAPAVRWDQNLTESVPVKDAYGIWRQTWQITDLVGEELQARIELARAENLRRIDRDVDAIYGAVIGNRGSEYEHAEAEANAYARAGYPADVPTSVSVWATVKGWTAKEAADDILSEAAQWRGAQASIRANRLQIKEHVRSATTVEEMNSAMLAWGQFNVAVRSQLSV